MVETARQLEEQAPEQKEFSFDEGLEEAVQRIHKLLESQDYVVVGVAGPIGDDIGVGKSTLSGMICQELIKQGIPTIKKDGIISLEKHIVKQLRNSQRDLKSEKGVVVLGALTFGSPSLTEEQVDQFKQTQDNLVQTQAQLNGLSVPGVDLRVLISRPDQPPQNTGGQIADIFVKNEKTSPRVKQ